eukprot:CAMPEP_0176167684 /NCGR_PEP_ID=MMETSP0120_2-20121206/85800_1 /TAXON_ID=160619 /ORGANISM="Kryptoperidinium foliaceum, Strain CCMP 1326" /LENGTH=36 /DNA_ID= /DNA_START= /DNA_END= /DNA_ORIENTATION=
MANLVPGKTTEINVVVLNDTTHAAMHKNHAAAQQSA